MINYITNLILSTPKLLLFLSSICGYLFFLNLRLKKNPHIIPLITISSIVMILYIGGIYSYLEQTSYFLFHTGQLLLLIWLMEYLKASTFRRKKILLETFNLPFLFFIGISCFYWFVLYYGLFSSSDEFSHWGKASKEIFVRNKLTDAKSILAPTFKVYPPATNIFHYFINKNISASFHEGITYFAHFILFFVTSIVLLPAYTGIKKIINLKNIFYSLLILYVLFLFRAIDSYFGIRSTYVDTLLCFYFVAAVVMYFRFKEKRNFTLLFVLPVLCIPTLTKISGFFFSLLGAVIITADYIADRSYANTKIKKTLLSILCIFLLFYIPVKTKKSWNNYLTEKKVQQVYSSSFKNQLSNIKMIFTDDLGGKRNEIVPVFLKGILYTHNIFTQSLLTNFTVNGMKITIFPASVWFLLILLFFLILRKNAPPKFKTRISVLFVVMTCFMFIYALAVLKVYLFHLSVFEAMLLASYSRYFGIYICSFFLVFYGILIHKKKTCVIIVISLLIGLTHPIKIRWMVPFTKPSEVERICLSPKMREKIDFVRKNTDNCPYICVIYQNTSGFITLVIRYTLNIPLIDYSAMSIGNLYSKKDIWTHDISVNEWTGILKKYNYQYVFLANADDNFWNRCGSIFTDLPNRREHFLWKIKIDEQEQVTLTPVLE